MALHTNRRCHPPAHSTQGYTLLELLVTMAIVTILAVMAIPSFQDSIERNAREAAMLDLMGAIAFGRSEAVSQSKKVSLCRSTDQSTCAASTAGDWDDGWIIFSDMGVAGTLNIGDVLLQVHGPSNDQNVITLKTSTNGNFTGDFLQFDEDGFLNNTTTGAYLKICDHDNVAAKARAIWLANTGRPALSTTDADGIQDDLAGANLVCP
jgi:type IV fimbrial biogenesis protein FimT